MLLPSAVLKSLSPKFSILLLKSTPKSAVRFSPYASLLCLSVVDGTLGELRSLTDGDRRCCATEMLFGVLLGINRSGVEVLELPRLGVILGVLGICRRSGVLKLNCFEFKVSIL